MRGALRSVLGTLAMGRGMDYLDYPTAAILAAAAQPLSSVDDQMRP